MFTNLVNVNNGVTGQYTRTQKTAFRSAVKAFIEQITNLVPASAAPIRPMSDSVSYSV